MVELNERETGGFVRSVGGWTNSGWMEGREEEEEALLKSQSQFPRRKGKRRRNEGEGAVRFIDSHRQSSSLSKAFNAYNESLQAELV